MDNLEERLKAAVLASALTEEKKVSDRKSKAFLRCAAIAAASAALALLLQIPLGPKDTYDDPDEAYAELERTFTYISQKIEKGAEIASRAEEPARTLKNIFE